MDTDGIKIDLFHRNLLRIGSVSVDLRRDKSSAVLACAALSQDHQISRSAVSTLLWGSSSERLARASLRQTVHRLKSDLPDGAVNSIAFEPDRISIHAPRRSFVHLCWLDQLLAGRIPTTLSKKPEICRRFCDSLFSISPDLDVFLLQEKSAYIEEVSLALANILQGNDRDAGIAAAQILVRLDDTNELARRHLMQSHAENGEPALAIREFEDLQKTLDEDYDVEPSQQTIDLVAKIKLGQINEITPTARAEHMRAQRVAPQSQLPTIKLRQPTADSAHPVPLVVKAFCSDLLSVLVRFREWSISDGAMNASSPAKFELSIEIVETIQDPVVVILLKETDGGRFIWSENLELSFDKWSRNHLEVVQNMATAIERSVSRSRLIQLKSQFPSNRSSFDLWIYCMDLVSTWRPEHFDEAAKLMHEIADIDPDFAPARSTLAALYNSRHLFRPGEDLLPSYLEEAARQAQAAVRLDPLDAKAQRVLGYSELMNHQFDQAHFHLSRAIELNSADPLTLVSAGLGLMFCGDAESADKVTSSMQVTRHDLPPFLMGYLVTLHVLAGRDTEALECARAAPDGILNIRGWQAIAHWRLGEKAQAAEAADAFSRSSKQNWHGNFPFSQDALCQWFRNAFPVRDRNVHERNVSALQDAMNFAAAPQL